MKKHIKTLLLVIIVFVAAFAIYFINSAIIDYRSNRDIAESITGKILPDNYKPILTEEFNNDSNNITRIAVLLAPHEHTITLIEGALLNTEEERSNFVKSLIKKINVFKHNKMEHSGIIDNKKQIILNDNFAISYDIKLKANKSNTFGKIYLINYSSKTLSIIILSKTDSFEEEVLNEFLENVSLP